MRSCRTQPAILPPRRPAARVGAHASPTTVLLRYRASISTRTPTVVIMNDPERFCCAPDGTVIPPAPAQSVLATRKPMLLLRLSGSFLLRLAERRFCGLLFQEPPRRTRRDWGRSGAGAQRMRGPAEEEIHLSDAADALSLTCGTSCFGDDAQKTRPFGGNDLGGDRG
jgi:hypothetical protein